MSADQLPDQSVREAYEVRDAKISYAGRRGMNSFADVEKALMDCAVSVGYPVESTAEDFDVVGVVADMVGVMARERAQFETDARQLHTALTRAHSALRSIWTYLHISEGQTHQQAGDACGDDLCIVCLCEELAKAGASTVQALVADLAPASDDQPLSDGETT